MGEKIVVISDLLSLKFNDVLHDHLHHHDLRHYYVRHFLRALRHPSQFWGWWLLLVALGFAMILAGILFNRRLSAAAAD